MMNSFIPPSSSSSSSVNNNNNNRRKVMEQVEDEQHEEEITQTAMEETMGEGGDVGDRTDPGPPTTMMVQNQQHVSLPALPLPPAVKKKGGILKQQPTLYERTSSDEVTMHTNDDSPATSTIIATQPIAEGAPKRRGGNRSSQEQSITTSDSTVPLPPVPSQIQSLNGQSHNSSNNSDEKQDIAQPQPQPPPRRRGRQPAIRPITTQSSEEEPPTNITPSIPDGGGIMPNNKRRGGLRGSTMTEEAADDNKRTRTSTPENIQDTDVADSVQIDANDITTKRPSRDAPTPLNIRPGTRGATSLMSPRNNSSSLLGDFSHVSTADGGDTTTGTSTTTTATAAGATTRKSSTAQIGATYPARAPWVDAQMAQAHIPFSTAFDRTTRPPSPLHAETRTMWCGTFTSETNEYLTFCRQLLHSGLDIGATPLEEDEEALAFLQAHDNDIQKAKLFLLSSIGGGTERANVLLHQIRDSKRPPRLAKAIRSGGAAAGAGSEGQDQIGLGTGTGTSEDPVKIKAMWKDWVTRCKRGLHPGPSTVAELIALQREEKNLPRLVSVKGEDDAFVAQAFEALTELDNRLRDVEEFAAAVHDALSLVSAHRSWNATTDKSTMPPPAPLPNMTKLVDSAPKRVIVKETEILKDLIAQCQAWDTKAQAWLAASAQLAKEMLSGGGSSSSSGGARRRHTTKPVRGAKPLSSPIKDEDDLTVMGLGRLIRQGQNLPSVDMAMLTQLMEKYEKAEVLTARVRADVPMEETGIWRSSATRKFVELKPLSSLVDLQTQLRKLGVRVPEMEALNAHVTAAEEWLAGCARFLPTLKPANTSNDESKSPPVTELVDKDMMLKELVAFAAKSDAIAVNLKHERTLMDALVERAQEWIKRARAALPPKNNKKLRGGEADKTSLETLRELRDEAIEHNIPESSFLIDTAEAIEDWIIRAKEAVRSGVAEETISGLLKEADDIPVLIPEERVLRMEMSARTWSKRALEILKGDKLWTVAEVTTLLDEADGMRESLTQVLTAAMASSTSTAPNTSTTTTTTTNSTAVSKWAMASRKKKVTKALSFEYEDEVRAKLQSVYEWLARAEMLKSGATNTSATELSIAQIENLLWASRRSAPGFVITNDNEEQPPSGPGMIADLGNISVSEARSELIENLVHISSWQLAMRALLDRTQQVNMETGWKQDVLCVMLNVAPAPAAMLDLPMPSSGNKLTLDEFQDVLDRATMVVSLPEMDVLRECDVAVQNWFEKTLPFDVSATSLAAGDGIPSSTMLQSGLSSSSEKNKKGGGGRRRRQNETLLQDRVRRVDANEELLNELKVAADTLIVNPTQRLAELQSWMEATIQWKNMANEALSGYETAVRLLHDDTANDNSPVGVVATSSSSPHDGDLPPLMIRLGLVEANKEDDEDGSGENMDPMQQQQQQQPSMSVADLDAMVPTNVIKALRGVESMMIRAESEGLHTRAVDSPSIRAAAVLWRFNLWMERIRRFIVKDGATVNDLCQELLYAHRKLLLLDNPSLSAKEWPKTLPPDSLAVAFGFPARAPMTRHGGGASSSNVDAPTIKRARYVLGETPPPPPPAINGSGGATEEEDDGGGGGSSSPSRHEETITSFSSDAEPAILQVIGDASLLLDPPGGGKLLHAATCKIITYLIYVIKTACTWMKDYLTDQSKAKADRSLPVIKDLLERGMLIPAIVNVDTELTLLRNEIAAAETWNAEYAKLFGDGKPTKWLSLDATWKFIARADKLLVSTQCVEHARECAKKSRDWIDRVKATGIERGEAVIDDLLVLMREGRTLRGVDITDHLSHLDFATKRYCMCQGSSNADMVICEDCKEVFHRMCLGPTFRGLCPVCSVLRAMYGGIGVGNAALIRILAASRVILHGTDTRFDALVDWAKMVMEISEGGNITPPPAQANELSNSFEVMAVMKAFKLKSLLGWAEGLRRRPTLKAVEDVLRSCNDVIRGGEGLAGLSELARRGRALVDLVTQIQMLPENVSAGEIVDRMRMALVQFDNLPLNCDEARDIALFCVNDSARRYCVCRRFDDGTPMVQCQGGCEGWFHTRCVRFTGDADMQEFTCAVCSGTRSS